MEIDFKKLFENNEELKSEILDAARGRNQREIVDILLEDRCPKCAVGRGTWGSGVYGKRALFGRKNQHYSQKPQNWRGAHESSTF